MDEGHTAGAQLESLGELPHHGGQDLLFVQAGAHLVANQPQQLLVSHPLGQLGIAHLHLVAQLGVGSLELLKQLRLLQRQPQLIGNLSQKIRHPGIPLFGGAALVGDQQPPEAGRLAVFAVRASRLQNGHHQVGPHPQTGQQLAVAGLDGGGVDIFNGRNAALLIGLVPLANKALIFDNQAQQAQLWPADRLHGDLAHPIGEKAVDHHPLHIQQTADFFYGKTQDGLHLQRLPDPLGDAVEQPGLVELQLSLLLGSLALGNIDNGGNAVDLFVGSLRHKRREVNPEDLAAFADVAFFHAVAPAAARSYFFDIDCLLPQILRVGEVGVIHAQELGLGVAGELAKALVHLDDLPRRIRNCHVHRGLLKEVLKQIWLIVQRVLPFLLWVLQLFFLGQILYAGNADYLPLGILPGGIQNPHRKPLAVATHKGQLPTLRGPTLSQPLGEGGGDLLHLLRGPIDKRGILNASGSR